MSTTSIPFSTLIREQTSVFPALADSDVVLERRDAENLVLMRDERYRAMAGSLRLAARSLALVAKADRGLAEEVFAEELPWLRWLPADDREQCVRDLLGELLAGAHTGLFMPFARSLVAWQHTAEAWSDPATAARLTRSDDTADAVALSMPDSGE
ncbi:hypothetical protein [Actinomadura parmotrematis]|uniref:Prevent-host-death protein n=1 Tax=Actinomadura parmotrematis TaxID=2864039 RepID=A0ABS7G512_9ACTN|nr:hypothetical protein [Actinomadura parmotrematis]MBW8487556.1 hypothetical protein [Actinomadura parmotrematis]